MIAEELYQNNIGQKVKKEVVCLIYRFSQG